MADGDGRFGDGRSGQRYLVISADGHDSPPDNPETLRPHVEAGFQADYADWVAGGGGGLFAGPLSAKQNPYEGFFRGLGMDDEWVSEAVTRYWSVHPPLDPAGRLVEVEKSGIAAELLVTAPPRVADNPALQRAVREAHHRYLIDHCKAAPGRFAAIVSPDWSDLDAALAEITRLRKEGLFGGVLSPDPNHLMNGWVAGGEGRALVDPYWEPLWSLCEDLQLPLVYHGGGAGDAARTYPQERFFLATVLELDYFGVRPLWMLMCAGVLDRHPKLKIATIEQQVATISGMLHDMDQQVKNFSMAGMRRSLNLLPSEYWSRHGFVGASFLDPYSMGLRHQIGVGNIMWGADYPHPEGSWPYVRPALQYVFGGLPQDEVRLMLGGNAAKVWDFDVDQLQTVADRIGPSVEDLAAPLPASETPPYATAITFGEPRRLTATA